MSRKDSKSVVKTYNSLWSRYITNEAREALTALLVECELVPEYMITKPLLDEINYSYWQQKCTKALSRIQKEQQLDFLAQCVRQFRSRSHKIDLLPAEEFELFNV